MSQFEPQNCRQAMCLQQPRQMLTMTKYSAQQGAVQSGMIALIIVIVLIGAGAYWQTQQHSLKKQQLEAERVQAVPEALPTVTPAPLLEPALALYPARLSLVTDAEGRLAGCSGIVGDVELRQQLIQQISGVFIDQYQPCEIDFDPAYQPEMMDINAVTRLAMIVRERPHSMLAINHLHMIAADQVLGEKGAVVISAPSADEFGKIEAAVREQTGHAFSLHQLQPVEDVPETVLQNIQTAHQMLKMLPASPRPADISAALNQQIIRFAADDAAVPALNQPLLSLVTEHLQRYPELNLQIRAFSPAVGSPQYSQTLSTARAEAIRQLWIEQGVSPERLLAVGMGQRQPIAENATEQGQFWNERVEFRWVKPIPPVEPSPEVATAHSKN